MIDKSGHYVALLKVSMLERALQCYLSELGHSDAVCNHLRPCNLKTIKDY